MPRRITGTYAPTDRELARRWWRSLTKKQKREVSKINLRPFDIHAAYEPNKVIRHRLCDVPWLGVAKYPSPTGCKRGFGAIVTEAQGTLVINGVYLWRRYLTEYQCRMGVRDLNKQWTGRIRFAGVSLI